MTSTPPGWYDDGHGVLRWWDGSRWTEHVATPDPEGPVDGEAVVDEPVAAAVPVASDAASTIDPRPGAAPRGDGFAELFGPPPAELAEGETPAESGYPAQGGAFVAATEPQKSKAWIAWLVAGVVLLGIVIAAAVVIPLLLLSGASGGGTVTTAPSGDEEAAAVAAVELYDEAWSEADCDKYLAATTENFRSLLDLADCESFVPAATDFSASVSDYEVAVVAIDQTAESTISVETVETYQSYIDETGQQGEELLSFEDRYTYLLVPVADGWAIDSAE